MANASLGIFIDDGLIKYAKVQKDKESYKVEAFNIVFYDNLESEINKIILETGSNGIPICVNLNHEMYNYFDTPAILKAKEKEETLKIDFETFCDENGFRKEDLVSQYLLLSPLDTSDRSGAVHISVDKQETQKIAKMFSGKKLTYIKPIMASIVNLMDDLGSDNAIIVNMEQETKVTAIINNEITRIEKLSVGMKDVLDAINETENSLRKSYDVCKNTTIYTDGGNEINADGNEHIDEIMPTLYTIAQETKNFIDDLGQTINRVYITGLGASINNIDLYFQEYLINSKCSILRPYFLNNSLPNSNYKDYIEVNSAIALALDEIGEGNIRKAFNFKKGFDPKSLLASSPELKNDFNEPLEADEKILLRVAYILAIALFVYIAFSNLISNRIASSKQDVETKISTVSAEISKANADADKIKKQADHYKQIAEILKNLVNQKDEIENAVPTIPINAVPNLMQNIAGSIPQDVMVLSIKNSTESHIVIEVVSPEYDQIGYFKALLSTKGYLANVKSSSGQNMPGYTANERNDGTHTDGQWIYVTIEGDLPK